MSSLRSILGGSRVRKNRGAKPSPSPRRATSSPATPSSAQGTKPRARAKPAPAADDVDYIADEDDELPQGRLDDLGAALLADDALRDVPQALRHVRGTMFAPLPARAGTGVSSTRTALTLTFRARLPPVASAAHVAAVLRSASATEREVDELARAGMLRRVLVPRRAGPAAEQLVEVADLARLARESGDLGDAVRGEFLAWLTYERGSRVPAGRFAGAVADELVRAGFLTAPGGSASAGLFARPEDRTSMISLETVARAASGSAGAVGGEGAVHAAGGSGGRGGGASGGDFALAVPGNGQYLKLVAAALEHLEALLARTPYREAPETYLRERWDGGVARDEGRGRGRLAGVPAGRTRKWREFHGLRFEWILAEAVGAGLVEVFETGSVGRGVRLT